MFTMSASRFHVLVISCVKVGEKIVSTVQCIFDKSVLFKGVYINIYLIPFLIQLLPVKGYEIVYLKFRGVFA